MDLQTRKLSVIEYVIGIQDEGIFSIIEDTIKKSKKEKNRSLRPFSQEDLIVRAKRSNEDYLSGNYKTQEQLEIESINW